MSHLSLPVMRSLLPRTPVMWRQPWETPALFVFALAVWNAFANAQGCVCKYVQCVHVFKTAVGCILKNTAELRNAPVDTDPYNDFLLG